MNIPSDNEKEYSNKQSGKLHVKIFWKTGLIISIVLSVVGTIILNLIFNH